MSGGQSPGVSALEVRLAAGCPQPPVEVSGRRMLRQRARRDPPMSCGCGSSNEPKTSEHDATNAHSIYYGSGYPIPAFHGIGARVFIIAVFALGCAARPPPGTHLAEGRLNLHFLDNGLHFLDNHSGGAS